MAARSDWRLTGHYYLSFSTVQSDNNCLIFKENISTVPSGFGRRIFSVMTSLFVSSIYSCFDTGCPAHKRVKAYATMPIGIMGSKSLRFKLIQQVGRRKHECTCLCCFLLSR